MLETIKSSTDISSAFSNGKRLSSPVITLLVINTPEEHGQKGRVAFVAGKKNGNAVWRNRAKRRMRAIARDLGAPWQGLDVVFIARHSTLEENYSKVLGQTKKILEEVVGKSNL